MDIKQLQYFIDAYSLQSFSEAAKLRYITPQGLHASINRLEEEIGDTLFIRTSSGLLLTPAGEYLLPKAQEIVKLVSEAAEHFAHEAEKENIVSVRFIRGTVEFLALPSIAKFKELENDADVHFMVETDLDCVQAVINGEADMAVCAGPIHSKELTSKLLFTRKHMLVINSKDPLAKKESVCIEDLKNVNLALPRERNFVRDKVLSLCKKKGFEPSYIENDEPRTAFNCAQIGLQAGIVNEISANKLVKVTENVSIIPFSDPEMSWNVYLIKKRDLHQTKLAKTYETCLLQTTNSSTDKWY